MSDNVIDFAAEAKKRENSDFNVILDVLEAVRSTYLCNKLGIVCIEGLLKLKSEVDSREDDEYKGLIQELDVLFEIHPSLQAVVNLVSTRGQPYGLLTRNFMNVTQDFVIPFEYTAKREPEEIKAFTDNFTNWMFSFGMPSEIGHSAAILGLLMSVEALRCGLFLIDYGIVPNNTDKPFAVIFQHNDLRITIYVDAMVLIKEYQDIKRITQP